ncbi:MULTISPECIES: hypothetical protein [unclassified Sporolactobacillus]|uniref:hypothetical protein n=1 Tax=unclassified Sporolactobacillus TaxID=2628533 RepID=UPI002368A6BF|nr:hypothetical protein [Sporolactobacillus sp. CQH2019]MDD9147271.1 hypothetical protein [Sporolactobacillus sp. CQH2019]
MKPLTALLLAVMAALCFLYYLLGLMHLHSLLLSGGFLFLIIFLLIRVLTVHPKKK